jgi:nucleoid DNA-binding protein
MAKVKTKKDIVEGIASAAGITKKQAGIAIDALVDMVYKGAKAPEGFTLPGLGKFFKARVKARKGVIQFGKNKGKEWKSAAHATLRCKVSKTAQTAVVGK